MNNFKIGDRVRILNAAPPFPKGTGATVTDVHSNCYGVLLDGDRTRLPAAFEEDELEAES